MGRAVAHLTLFGLLLALTAARPNKDDWDIYSFNINSTVTSRYATTVITSRVANRMDESKEIEFHVRIPKNAFISKFRMFIDGEVYDGTVKEKEQAQRQYTEAASRGESAGIVSSVGRTLEEFKTSVNVAAHKKVTFELTYEELMKRTLGKYELQIHARPMQPVRDFKVDVHIQEKAGINFIDVKGGLSTKALANAITKTFAGDQAWVHFYPTEDQQKSCDSCSEQGMNGDLVIVYDVNRDAGIGDITKSAGHFVHHFAPSDLPRIPKNVVFVIDQSGSMHGRKMEQTRLALIRILSDLAEDDHFGLISFDDKVFHWKRELLQATSANLESAKKFARGIQDRGSTDINKAVLEGTRMLNAHPREGSASILILLTDGDPTSGETNIERLQSNVRRAINGKFPLYCLGFGFDVNFEFLEKMSLQNSGLARRIYEDSDADLQLKGFYEEVATPLLTDVMMVYEGGANLTQTNFSQYYNGSEIVVAGCIDLRDRLDTFTPQVVAISAGRRVTYFDSNSSVELTEAMSDEQIQRVWAYLTVKQLLQKELQLSGPEKEKVKQETLELSKKYSFVTPLTSMVVTKPPGETADVLHKPKEGKAPHSPPWAGAGAAGGAVGRGGGGGRLVGGGSGLAYAPPAALPDFYGPPGPVGQVPGSYFPPAFQLDLEDVGIESVMDYDYGVSRPRPSRRPRPATARILPTQIPMAATTGPTLHRFLVKPNDLSSPLCFDIYGGNFLKLLHQPSRELFVNGELDSETDGGFKHIYIHFGSDNHIEVDTEGVSVRMGQNTTRITQPEMFADASVTVVKVPHMVDIAVGDMRLMVFIHEKARQKFLWPGLRQKPSAADTEGILALGPAVYEEIQRSPSPKLKIKDQEIDVTNTSAVDYSIITPVTMSCWLIPAETALQRPLTDVFVSQL